MNRQRIPYPPSQLSARSFPNIDPDTILVFRNDQRIEACIWWQDGRKYFFRARFRNPEFVIFVPPGDPAVRNRAAVPEQVQAAFDDLYMEECLL